jgi:NAD(P)-dependent dehydrogenase (short-subunit alcohol dehydrogenase family)
MDHRLEGKTVIITGAASGLGRAGALLFARSGANLALCDVNEQGLAETVELVSNESDGEILAESVDIAKLADLSRFAAAVTERFDVVDVIYNNAGINHVSSIEDTSEEDWNHVHNVNVRAPAFLVKFALPALRRSTSGSIINVSSGSGLVAPTPRNTVYCSSKGAVIALTRAQAQDLAPYNIRVNCLVPGLIDTPMPAALFAALPLDQQNDVREASVSRSLFKRFGRPEEVASVAVFLATSDASFITGAIIPVDAGFTAV